MDDIWLHFKTVAETLNLTRSAVRLEISQPTLSQQIMALEKKVGTPLFERTNRGLRLTPAGVTVYNYAKQYLLMLDEMKIELRKINETLTGNLVIAASFTVAEAFLPPVLIHFKRRYPKVQLHLQVQNTRHVIDLLTKGQAEIGFVEAPVFTTKFQEEIIAQDELGVVVSSSHRWAGDHLINLAEFIKEPLIIREEGSGIRKVLEEKLSEAGVDLTKLNISIELGNISAIKALVMENIGISVLSRYSAIQEIANGQLVFLPIAEVSLNRSFLALIPQHSIANRWVNAFKTMAYDHGWGRVTGSPPNATGIW